MQHIANHINLLCNPFTMQTALEQTPTDMCALAALCRLYKERKLRADVWRNIHENIRSNTEWKDWVETMGKKYAIKRLEDDPQTVFIREFVNKAKVGTVSIWFGVDSLGTGECHIVFRVGYGKAGECQCITDGLTVLTEQIDFYFRWKKWVHQTFAALKRTFPAIQQNISSEIGLDKNSVSHQLQMFVPYKKALIYVSTDGYNLFRVRYPVVDKGGKSMYQRFLEDLRREFDKYFAI